MAKLVFDAIGEHTYETGVSKGVLFVKALPEEVGENIFNGHHEGVVWNGLTAVTESPEGAEETVLYADNIKYLSLRSAEDFKATIEAYTYPEEFGVCDGSANLVEGIPGVKIAQQKRRSFAFCYRTEKSNDEGVEGYIIHIIYGCTASPSEKAYATVNESPEAITFSWELSTLPVSIDGFKPTAHIEIDSTKCPAGALAAIEAKLYGTDSENSVLLMPNDIIEILQGAKEKLAAPTLTANDTDSQLTITVASDSEAESFDIYEGSVYVKNVAKSASATTVAYSTLGLAAGKHYLKAKAQGGAHLDSDFSSRVLVTIAE